MEWLSKNSEKLKISRDAAALAQLYTDLYYGVTEYHSKEVVITLASTLLIASK